MTPFEKDVLEYSKRVDKFTSSRMAIDLGYDTNVPYIHLMKMWRKGLIAKVLDNANWVYTRMPDVLRCPQCGNWPRVTMGGDLPLPSVKITSRSIPIKCPWRTTGTTRLSTGR